MNKKLTIGLMGLFAVSLVTAGLVINTLVLNVGVEEPFTVQYAVLGDGGDYVSSMGSCADYAKTKSYSKFIKEKRRGKNDF